MSHIHDKGWLSFERKLFESELWLDEPFTRGQAWLDLIFLANYKEGHLFVRGNYVPIARGQVGWSEVKLATRWHWSRNKVRALLIRAPSTIPHVVDFLYSRLCKNTVA